MLTKQDITVLSELLDQGLKPVREDLNRLHKDFEGLNNKFNELRQDMNEKIEGLRTETVSYTHLDVYKRQVIIFS